MLNSSLFRAPRNTPRLGSASLERERLNSGGSLSLLTTRLFKCRKAWLMDCEFIHTGAERVRLASLEIQQILEEHEQEHGCWW
jgi:hypothetical protein